MVDHQSDVASVTVDSEADGPQNPSVKTDNEKTTQHTPGPWTFRAEDAIHGSPQTFGAIVYGAENNHYMADIFGASRHGDVIPWEANARLIAAAPELLEALTDVMTLIEDGILVSSNPPGDFTLSAIYLRISTAIAKATQR